MKTCSLCNTELVVELNNDGKLVAFCRYHAEQFADFWRPGKPSLWAALLGLFSRKG